MNTLKIRSNNSNYYEHISNTLFINIYNKVKNNVENINNYILEGKIELNKAYRYMINSLSQYVEI